VNQTVKAVIFWGVIVVSAYLLWQVVRTGSSASQSHEISYSQFLSEVSDGKVARVKIEGCTAVGYYKNGGTFTVVVPSNQAPLMEALQQHGVEIWFRDVSQQNWPNWLLNLAPLILLGALWFFMIRQMRMRRGSWPPPGPSGAGPAEGPGPRFGP